MELMSESSQVVVASVSSSSTLFIQRSCKKKPLYYAINTNSFAETAVRVFGTGEGSFQPHAEFSPQCVFHNENSALNHLRIWDLIWMLIKKLSLVMVACLPF